MAVLFDFLVRALFILFQVMEIGLIVYVFITWIPFFPGLRQNVSLLMAPLLQPIQKLLRKSVIQIRGIDLSPLILFVIVAYCKRLCLIFR